MVPCSYPSFARHYVERYTRMGDAHIHASTLLHTHTYTHTRAHTDVTRTERTCDSAHEDVSRHRHIWPLYRVNVRSNALLNNVRSRTDERRTFTSLSRSPESRPSDRIDFRSTVVQLLAEFRVRAFHQRIDFSVCLV